MKFLDTAKIHLKSGSGGNGCVSFHRGKNIEFGGPDGGNGGKGGDVFIRCTSNLNTLIDYRYQQHFKAQNGISGMGKNRTGKSGRDCIINVPPGTQVFCSDQEVLIADLTRPGQQRLIARGGNGGFGNTHFKSSTNRCPRHSNPGLPGESLTVVLKLKLIAHAGLVGLPNAGKSTFLSSVSQAKPKIADYPFTTLYPNLGMVRIHDHSFVLADIPGLIEGAATGTGLGSQFLGHIERTNVLLHIVDATSSSIARDYTIVRQELSAYGSGLDKKKELVALSKCDAVTDSTLRPKLAELQAVSGKEPYRISALVRLGLTDILFDLARCTKKSEEASS